MAAAQAGLGGPALSFSSLPAEDGDRGSGGGDDLALFLGSKEGVAARAAAADEHTARAVLDSIAPGLARPAPLPCGPSGAAALVSLDAEATLPLVAPRPLLLVNGSADGRCPVEGLRAPAGAAEAEYKRLRAGDRFRLEVAEG